jgi:prepilin-type N-terminal cleavage/methylation domain-containing protein
MIAKFIKRKKNRNKKGFTLVEAVISIAIFGMITIFMTNFIMSVVKFSVDNEKRADIMIDLDKVATTIKNELRTAEGIQIVNDGGIKCINYNKGTETYNVVREDDGSNNSHRDRIFISNIGNGNTGCHKGSNSRYLNDRSIVSISNFELDFDGSNISPNSWSNNNILYVIITACDSDDYGIPEESGNKIFACNADLNPYLYIFGITTKNLDPSTI